VPDTVPTVIGCRCDQVAIASEFGIRQAGGPQVEDSRPSKSGAGSKVRGAVDRGDSRRVDPDVLIEKVAATFKTWVQDGTVKRFGTSKAGV